MKVVVQKLDRNLFLRRQWEWTESRMDAMAFPTVLDAITFCIYCGAGDVRLIAEDQSGREVHLYPFGRDPVRKLELKRLRRSIRESRRLKAQRQMIRARIDLLMAEGKEKKKQFPFRRRPISEAGEEE